MTDEDKLPQQEGESPQIEDELPQIIDRLRALIEAEGLVTTVDREEPILHEASTPDAVPGFSSGTGPSDPPEKESDARLPSMDIEPRGRLARTAPLFFFFVFSMLIVFLFGMFIGASGIANLPTRLPPAEVNVPVPFSPRIETPTPDSSTAGYSSREPATSQRRPANMTTTEAAPAPSSSPTALPTSAPVAPNPVPAPTPASEQPAVMVGVPSAAAEPLTERPTPSETAASTASPIAPAPAPATIPAVPDLSDIERQVLLSRGDAFFSAGDVTSARLFYQRGADAGDGTAALRLGETFDAGFLERAHLGRVPSDLEKAVSWYRRARDLGIAEAEILLEELARQLKK